MILDQSRNKEHQDLQLSTNLTWVFVLYITLPKVQNEDPVKTVLKFLEITRKRLEHDSRPKQKQGATRFAFMRFQDDFDGVFVLYFWWGYVQNEETGQIR